MRLSRELIYEAAIDDDTFDQLPIVIADHLGGRSCLLHWRDAKGSREIFAHSRYWNDDQLTVYAADFADRDVWTLAALDRPNQSWLCSDLVSDDEYRNSVPYNDWVRAMGDDTFRCVGAITNTRAGLGIVGVHRGRTQSDFDRSDRRRLEHFVPDLRRMFAMRLRLIHAQDRAVRFEQILEALPDAVFVVDRRGRVRSGNAAAEAMLLTSTPLRLNHGRLTPTAFATPPIDDLIAQATAVHAPVGGSGLLFDVSGAILQITVQPWQAAIGNSGALVIVRRPGPESGTAVVIAGLIRRYGLSNAESEIAVLIADGVAINTIAEKRRVRVGTVRSQVKAIMSKLGVNRQSQIVGIVASMRR